MAESTPQGLNMAVAAMCADVSQGSVGRHGGHKQTGLPATACLNCCAAASCVAVTALQLTLHGLQVYARFQGTAEQTGMPPVLSWPGLRQPGLWPAGISVASMLSNTSSSCVETSLLDSLASLLCAAAAAMCAIRLLLAKFAWLSTGTAITDTLTDPQHRTPAQWLLSFS